MRSPEGRVVRPTLRCLIEDLGDEVGPAELRLALRTAVSELQADAHFLLPVALEAAEHSVLDKANLIATDPVADRIPIKAVTDRRVLKVKTGDRRGALWQDGVGGTWWLLAAGTRRDDGSGDFYRTLERYRTSSDPITPTELDQRYRRFEAAYLAELESERTAQARVLRVLLDAAAGPGTPRPVDVFGAMVRISVEAEDDASDLLSISFDFTSFEQQDRFPVDIVGFVPGYESLDDWDILPPLRPGDPQCWFTYVRPSWIDWLATAVELDKLVEENWAAPTPPINQASQLAHRAPAKVVTLAYVEGVEITALCGARCAPSRNPDDFTECPTCAASLALLRKQAGE